MYKRKYREILGLSQSQLARISGISRFRVNQFEMGEFEILSAEDHAKLMVALESTADRMLDAVAEYRQTSGKQRDAG